MDYTKTGRLIRMLRREKGLTQLQLAQKLHVSDKAVSKWERGLGGPDVSLPAGLSDALGAGVESLLCGELPPNEDTGGNMKKNLERQRQLRDQKRARLEKLMADVQALEQAVQEEENAAIIATVRKFELSPEELALALEELRHNVVAPSLEAKAKQDKEQMEEEEIDEEAELPQD